MRVGPWHAGRGAAQLAPLPGEPLPSPALLRCCLDDLTASGCPEVYTSALTPAEQPPFLAAGFVVREELHLLVRPLDDLPGLTGPVELRRPRRGDWTTIEALDERAFDEFWHLDRHGIADAQRATPSHRTRVAVTGAGVVGYAVHGRSGGRGYVQRLAVDPRWARQGIGSALLLDGLRWMRLRGVRRAYVNTQVGNTAALACYGHHGFALEPDGLAVLGLRTEQP